MSVFMLSLLFGPFEAAGRLPQLKIKRWAIGTIKLSFRKLNSNLREQVGRAPAVVALLYGMAQAPVVRRNRIRIRRPWAYDLRGEVRSHAHFAEYGWITTSAPIFAPHSLDSAVTPRVGPA